MRVPARLRWSNRWRITGWILGSVAVVTVVAGLFAVVGVRDRLTDELDADLRDESRNLGVALDVLDADQLQAIGEAGTIGYSSTALVVVGPDGHVVAVPSGSRDDPDPLPSLSPTAITRLRGQAGEPIDLPSEDGSLTYRALPAVTSDGTLTVVATPLTDRDQAVRSVAAVLVVTGLLAGVVLAVTVVVVSGWITRPLDAMIDAAEAIGEGDLASRVPAEGVEDVARLAAALNAMLDRIEEAFAARAASEDALRRFVADASHELRTPLATILGYAELHASGMAASPADAERAMGRIASEGERMRVIVEELLTLARLDEGRALESRPVDLGALVAEAVADARARAPDRPVRLTRGDGPTVVTGDALSLRQAVDNLLANTRAHTPAGTPVDVAVTAHGDEVVLTVADEGPGLAPEAAARAFDRFYRAEASRSRPGGAGLGLAIVAAVAEGHGGAARVTSTPGEGATFTLALPRAGALPDPAAPAGPEAGAAEAGRPATAG